MTYSLFFKIIVETFLFVLVQNKITVLIVFGKHGFDLRIGDTAPVNTRSCMNGGIEQQNNICFTSQDQGA